MNDEYPRMLYRPGTRTKAWGVMVDTLIVRDEDEQADALKDGWSLRPDGEGEKADPLDHDGNGKKGGSKKPAGDLKELRAEYKRVVGKPPFNGWDEATLKAKIAEKAGG